MTEGPTVRVCIPFHHSSGICQLWTWRICLQSCLWLPTPNSPSHLEAKRAGLGLRHRLKAAGRSSHLTAANPPGNPKLRFPLQWTERQGELSQSRWHVIVLIGISLGHQPTLLHLADLNIKNSLFIMLFERPLLFSRLFKLLIRAEHTHTKKTFKYKPSWN